MKVATLQFGIQPGEGKQSAFHRVEEMLAALPEKVDLVLLPELWNVGFFAFDSYKSAAEPLHGETLELLSAAARRLDAHIFTGSFVEKRDERYYNTCALLDRSGALLADYQKIHLFGYGSKEREILSGGRRLAVADTEFGKVGLSICYDLRFPELYRKLADMGAEVLINCAAWPYPRVENWVAMNQVRAMENQAYFLSCCCAGGGVGTQFIGRSMVVDPWGTPVAMCGERESVMITEIHPEQVARIREDFTPLKDRVFPVAGLPD